MMSKKYGGARGATSDVTIWRISGSCCVSKASCTHAHADAHSLGHMHVRAHTHIPTNI